MTNQITTKGRLKKKKKESAGVDPAVCGEHWTSGEAASWDQVNQACSGSAGSADVTHMSTADKVT